MTDWPMVNLGELIEPARSVRAGDQEFPILSMTMHEGLVDQSEKFNKRVASSNTSSYKVIVRGQLVVGFPIDEGVLSFQTKYDRAIVSPAYKAWDIIDAKIEVRILEFNLRSPRALEYYKSKLRGSTERRRSLPDDIFLELKVPLPPIEEQERIALMLATIDALKTNHRRTINKLDELSKSLSLQSHPLGLEK